MTACIASSAASAITWASACSNCTQTSTFFSGRRLQFCGRRFSSQVMAAPTWGGCCLV
jgi:hypothetical protein